MDHNREHETPPLARVMGVGRQQHVRGQLIAFSLASCLEREPLMPFSSCTKYKRNTKQRRRRCCTIYAFMDLEKAFDRVQGMHLSFKAKSLVGYWDY